MAQDGGVFGQPGFVVIRTEDQFHHRGHRGAGLHLQTGIGDEFGKIIGIFGRFETEIVCPADRIVERLAASIFAALRNVGKFACGSEAIVQTLRFILLRSVRRALRFVRNGTFIDGRRWRNVIDRIGFDHGGDLDRRLLRYRFVCFGYGCALVQFRHAFIVEGMRDVDRRTRFFAPRDERTQPEPGGVVGQRVDDFVDILDFFFLERR